MDKRIKLVWKGKIEEIPHELKNITGYLEFITYGKFTERVAIYDVSDVISNTSLSLEVS